MTSPNHATPVQRFGTGPMKSFSGVNGAAVGATFELPGTLKDFGVQLNISGGTLSALSVNLQGSVDGTQWFNLGSAITGTSTSYTAIAGNPVKFVRLNGNTFTVATGTPTLDGFICGL